MIKDCGYDWHTNVKTQLIIKGSVIQMAENKMKQVAAMFGKQLGEDFKIKDLMTGKIYVALFDNYGMRAYVEGFPHSWKPRRDMVMRLIVCEAVIVDE